MNLLAELTMIAARPEIALLAIIVGLGFMALAGRRDA